MCLILFLLNFAQELRFCCLAGNINTEGVGSGVYGKGMQRIVCLSFVWVEEEDGKCWQTMLCVFIERKFAKR